MGFLSRSFGNGPQLALKGQSGFSRVAAGFLSSYDGDLRDPPMGPQGGPVSTQISRAPSGFLCNRCRGRGPHLELKLESQISSQGPTWISGFLWGIHRGVRVSSHMVPCKTALLLTWKSSVSFPVWFTIVIGGFPIRGNRPVTTAIVF